MPFKRRFKDKYAGSQPERICCPNSVRLVNVDGHDVPVDGHCVHGELTEGKVVPRQAQDEDKALKLYQFMRHCHV